MATVAIKNTLTSNGVVYEDEAFHGIVRADDPEGGEVRYSLANGSIIPYGIRFNPLTGEFSGTPTLTCIDPTDPAYGKKSPTDHTWTFTVIPSDGVNKYPPQDWSITVKHKLSTPSISGSTTLNITLNEGASTSVNIASQLGITVPEANSAVYDQTGFTPPTITYTASSGKPSWLSLSSNGTLSGTAPATAFGGSNTTFTVNASLPGGSITITINVHVNHINLPPVWSTAAGSIGTYTYNSAFTYNLVATDPENQTLTYSLVGGAFPAGISMNSSGGLSGTLPTPLVNTTYNFTVRVTDPSSAFVDRTFSMVVTGNNIPPSWNTASGTLASPIVGTPISVQLSGTDPENIATTYSLVSGSFPTGVSMTSDGLISGTPSAVGTTTFTIGLSDGVSTVNRSFSIVVQPVPNDAPTWTTAAGSLGSYVSRSNIGIQLGATDPDNDTLAFSLVGGSLPSGLSMNSSGYISGVLATNSYAPYTYVQGTVGNLVYNGGLTLGGSVGWTNSGFTWQVVNNPSTGAPERYYYMTGTNATAYSARFAVIPSSNYTYSFYAYLSTVASGGTLRVFVRWYNSSDSAISDSDVTTITVNDPATYQPSGQRYIQSVGPYRTVVSPANAAYGRMYYTATNVTGNTGQRDIHVGFFKVQTGSTFTGFSDEATNGENYQTIETITNTGTDITSSFTVQIDDGHGHTSTRSFSITNKAAALYIEKITSSTSWTVPADCTKVMFNWIVGGGGSGGWGHETGNGGGGGGGGSGGYYSYQEIQVAQGDTISFEIGAGGVSDPNNYCLSSPPSVILDGNPGGDTVVRKNGTEILRATGGGGGQTNPNRGAGFLIGAAGVGGSPNGVTAQDGSFGSNDYASSNGGAGAPGPLIGAAGGAGGIARATPYTQDPNNRASYPVMGQNGIGYGSGGGGGGSYDRPAGIAAGTYWSGGTGVQGYVEFAHQSAGQADRTSPR